MYRTAPDVQVVVESQRPADEPRGDIVLVHGLEGSAVAGYMRSVAAHAVERGYAAHRLNLRSCGGTERLARTAYHAGLTSDLLAVVRALAGERCAPVWLVGFSLGGNLAAKLAGELGDDARSLLAGICAASAAIDLEACAHRIGQPDNRFYELRFLMKMRARAAAVWRSTPAELHGIRSIIEMDDRITAPHNGFRSAEHYYRTQSANQFLGRIRVPALFIAAKDDTLVPFRIYDHPAFKTNPCLTLLATEHGGHLGFVARGRPRLWLEHAIMEWIGAHGTNHPFISSGY
ncbi:MAG TPA: alpha/beta fold hydrolase [Bryobacteraceae bacterium]|nr:alpha/beta fold hydrolase [Bryobacteraceae bacterium]